MGEFIKPYGVADSETATNDIENKPPSRLDGMVANGRLLPDARKFLRGTASTQFRQGPDSGFKHFDQITEHLQGEVNGHAQASPQQEKPKELDPRLAMLDPKNVGNLELFRDLLDYWFGPKWPAVAYYANMGSEYAKEHEADLTVNVLAAVEKRRLSEEREQAGNAITEPGRISNEELEELEYQHDEKRDREIVVFRRRARQSTNRWFFNQVGKTHSPVEESSRRFTERQFEYANQSTEYEGETLFDKYPSVVGLLNEVGLHFDLKPHKIIELMASPNTHPMLKYEITRWLTKALISAPIDAREARLRGRGRLYRMQELFDDRLYDGLTGETEMVWVTSYHDKGTKTTEYVNDVSGPTRRRAPVGTVRMSTPLRVRHLQDFDFPVLTNPDPKKQAAAIIKAERKAEIRSRNGKGDVINPTEDVLDTTRLRFAVLGGMEDAEAFRERFCKVLLDPKSQATLAEHDDGGDPMFEEPNYDAEGNPILDKYGDLVITETIENFDGTKRKVRRKKYKGRVMRIINDNAVNDDNSASNGIDWLRMKIYQSDSEVPTEAVIQDIFGFLDGEHEVGERIRVERKVESNGSTRTERKTRFTGSAHKIYEAERAIDVRGHVFPDEHYATIIDLGAEEDRTYRNIAQSLLRQELGKIK